MNQNPNPYSSTTTLINTQGNASNINNNNNNQGEGGNGINSIHVNNSGPNHRGSPISGISAQGIGGQNTGCEPGRVGSPIVGGGGRVGSPIVGGGGRVGSPVHLNNNPHPQQHILHPRSVSGSPIITVGGQQYIHTSSPGKGTPPLGIHHTHHGLGTPSGSPVPPPQPQTTGFVTVNGQSSPSPTPGSQTVQAHPHRSSPLTTGLGSNGPLVNGGLHLQQPHSGSPIPSNGGLIHNSIVSIPSSQPQTLPPVTIMATNHPSPLPHVSMGPTGGGSGAPGAPRTPTGPILQPPHPGQSPHGIRLVQMPQNAIRTGSPNTQPVLVRTPTGALLLLNMPPSSVPSTISQSTGAGIPQGLRFTTAPPPHQMIGGRGTMATTANMRPISQRVPIMVSNSGSPMRPIMVGSHHPGSQLRAPHIIQSLPPGVPRQAGPRQIITTGTPGGMVARPGQTIVSGPGMRPGLMTTRPGMGPNVIQVTVPVSQTGGGLTHTSMGMTRLIPQQQQQIVTGMPPPGTRLPHPQTPTGTLHGPLSVQVANSNAPPMNSQQSGTLSGTSGSGSRAPGTGGGGGEPMSMSPRTCRMKCKNFLATLLRLANEQQEQVANNVKGLIQSLIDGQIPPEVFTQQLQDELKSAPQPCLVPFLRRSLPYLRDSLITGEVSIEGVRPPKPGSIPSVSSTGSHPGAYQPAGIRSISANNSASGLTRNTSSSTPPKAKPAPKSKAAAKKNSAAISGAASASASTPSTSTKEKKSSKGDTGSKSIDDDDVNDVAAMGGVNLAEESQKILAAGAETIGTLIRSCKDESIVASIQLQNRVNGILKKQGLDQAPQEVVSLISHAVQELLKNYIEKLGLVAEHRMDNVKNDPRYELVQDVRSQVKFLEELDRLEKKRHEERERELLYKAAKSRSKPEDPEQIKLKQRAKEVQRAELEEARQREANETALLAIGPRKKFKSSNGPPDISSLGPPGASSLAASNNPFSAGHQSPTSVSSPFAASIPLTGVANHHSQFSGGLNGSTSLSTAAASPFAISNKPTIRRIKRVNLRDLLFLLEQERSTARSLVLYKLHAK